MSSSLFLERLMDLYNQLICTLIVQFLQAATKLGQGNIFTSVCLSTGGEGCLPQCMLEYPTPPGSRHPQEQTPPQRSRHPHPPGADTPREQTPPLDQPPPREADCSIRLTSGRYASYWNAFLSLFFLHKQVL